MTAHLRQIKGAIYGAAAVLLLVTIIVPALPARKVLAAQLSSRSITMSDSAPSGTSITTGVGSGTDVSYEVGFTTSVASESLVIDFCSEDPIINDTCTGPTGMNAASATVTAGTGNIGGAGWTITPSASQIKLASDGNATHTAAAGAQVFTLSGITNPSTTGSFYARIYTYALNTFGTYTSATSVGDYEDYGGVALSTAQAITITARVQETLSFCVSGTIQSSWTPNGDCTDAAAATAPALVIGSATTTPVLDPQHVYTGTVYSQLSTNATHGAVIDMRNSNTSCGGLSADNGATCAIPPIGATATAMTAGTADFGMFAPASTDGPSGTGTVTPQPPYSTAGDYGMDNTAGTGVSSTYGSLVASTTGPCYRVNNSYTFAATDSLTTPAGIYTANMDLIATGTF